MDELVKHLGIAKSGDVVFLECDSHISEETMKSINIYLEDIYKKSGVLCVVLGDGIKVARIEKDA